MDVHHLDRIFRPDRIVVFGANENPRSVGCTVLHNLVTGGFRGVVYPVHPRLEAVQGIHCYPDVGSLPRPCDLAVICSAAAEVPDLVRQCGEAGILGVVILSAGFGEVDEAGRELEERIREQHRRFEGMRILGPNCLGVIVPQHHLNVSFAHGMPKPGPVAFVSQSGALCTSVLDWALQENVGFSHFVSVGNTLDVDFGDLIDYFGENEACESVILYMESLKDARGFMAATRAFARQKPIVAYKGGRFAESAKAAGSHTGAMAGEDAVYQAAFQRAGIARVFEIGEIFDCAELVARYEPPRGPRLGIVTNAGGPGVMATDTLIAQGGVLATLGEETVAKLDLSLPPPWSHGNPVDVLGDARPKRVSKACELTLADPNVDALLVILTPQAMTKPTTTARQLSELAGRTRKPILAAWLGGASMREGMEILNQAGIATYDTPEQAVRAFMTLVAYARNLETLFELPRDIPLRFGLDRQRLRKDFASLLPAEGDTLTEADSKRLLAAYGIGISETHPAASADEAVRLADELGYPVVLKILSPDITHKTDVGGVALDLADADAVCEAFDELLERARAHRPDARLEGVTVQPMVRRGEGHELILGCKQDPTFGAVLMVGMGGVTAEIYRDRSLGLPPLNERLAMRMLKELRSWPVLEGHRGRPGVDLDALVEVLMRFSYLVADYPEIRELDINPLLAGPGGCIALDARVILDRDRVASPPRPYSHLALRPYPEEYVSSITMEDGSTLTLRPIRPEDEPLWMELLGSCSAETLYARFRGNVYWAAHETATRYCYIDYEREIALVAETGEGEARRLVGVGRLVAAPDLREAEYAVLVRDEWQNRGLGGILTERCEEIAREMGVGRIVAETSTDNHRMIRVFESRGYELRTDHAEHTVHIHKEMDRFSKKRG